MARSALAPAFAVSLLATSMFAAPASADLPPPPGVRRVDFQVRVDGLAAFPEMVLIAYPYSASNGAPTTEHAVLRDGEPLTLGRRSPTPKIWAVKKTDYEAFLAAYTPTRSFEDAPLDTFVRSKGRDCGAKVEPVFQLPIASPRASAGQSFHADAVDAAHCQLTAGPEAAPAPTDTGERAEPVAAPPDAPAPDASQRGHAPSSAEPPKTNGGGCAGCAATGSTSSTTDGWMGAVALAMCAAGIAVARRRP